VSPPLDLPALDALFAQAGVDASAENADLIREMIATILRLAKQSAPRGDLKIINTAIKELRHALGVFGRYRGTRKVTIFGSARLPADSPECHAARAFAARIADRGFMVITGGAGGIMEAGNEGAGRERSFGVNIRLPFEQGANPVLVGDEKLLWFKYFFTRKLMFVKESDAIALFPGGFGTHDEGFEALTLAQTGKNRPIPIVLVDKPGGTYWTAWRRFVEEEIVGRGLASKDDLAFFSTFDDAGLAAEAVARFYRNYHSSRFVRERFVIRLTRPIPQAALATVNAEFRDLCVSGVIETTAPLDGEENEPEAAALPRLVLDIDRHRFARLKQMIDRLNTLY
jgi:uncharacterized protein (TIGR00730 family)